jgi:hypothetical protein
MNMLTRPKGNPNNYSEKEIVDELILLTKDSLDSLVYFIFNYAHILSNDAKGWIPFTLWTTDCSPYDNQLDLVKKVYENNFVAILKSRQVGITWLSLTIALWLMLFHPQQAILLLSKGDKEARELLKRLKGIYSHLPYWMKAKEALVDNNEEWALSNGSRAKSVSTRGGDSMSFTVAIIDEADLIYRANTPLQQVLLNVEPTVGLNGKLILLSKAEKSRPKSTFKNIFKGAVRGTNRFVHSFIPWKVNPLRTEEWYKAQVEISLDIDGTLDTVHESYPATPQEALSPKSGNKRLPYVLVGASYKEKDPIFIYSHAADPPEEYDGADIAGLYIYEYAKKGMQYAIGVDPAEGLATSDFSGLSVVDENLNQVARYKGRVDPQILALYAHKISKYYNNAPVLYERNNHGILFKKEMQEKYQNTKLLKGWVANGKRVKPGWFTTTASKSYMYDTLAAKYRELKKHNKNKPDDEKIIILHDEETYTQLTSIENSTYKAPPGEEDDLAIAHSLAIVAVLVCLDYSVSLKLIKLNR